MDTEATARGAGWIGQRPAQSFWAVEDPIELLRVANLYNAARPSRLPDTSKTAKAATSGVSLEMSGACQRPLARGEVHRLLVFNPIYVRGSQGNEDLDASPATRSIGDADSPSMSLDQTASDGQTKPRSSSRPGA